MYWLPPDRWAIRLRDLGLKDQTHAFFMKHPSFFKLVPPSEGLLIFRVMGGLKGLMAKMKARVNVHEMAVDIARRRGRLTAMPKPSTLRPPG